MGPRKSRDGTGGWLSHGGDREVEIFNERFDFVSGR